jgi:NADPH2:quinone reductase
LKPVIDARFPLADATAALTHVEGRKVKGKVLLTLGAGQ